MIIGNKVFYLRYNKIYKIGNIINHPTENKKMYQIFPVGNPENYCWVFKDQIRVYKNLNFISYEPINKPEGDL